MVGAPTNTSAMELDAPPASVEATVLTNSDDIVVVELCASLADAVDATPMALDSVTVAG